MSTRRHLAASVELSVSLLSGQFLRHLDCSDGNSGASQEQKSAWLAGGATRSETKAQAGHMVIFSGGLSLLSGVVFWCAAHLDVPQLHQAGPAPRGHGAPVG